MTKKTLKKILSVLSAAVIIAPTVTSAVAQASEFEDDLVNSSLSANMIAVGFHSDNNNSICECELTGSGKGVKIALLDAGVTEYDTFEHISFIDDDTIDSDHGDLMMSILSERVPDADIMDIRVLDDNGEGTYANVSKGVHWAVDNEADIIVMSFAGESNTSLLGEAVEYAENHNVLVIAAAGNSSSEQMLFPAAFDTVISVGAIDTEGNICDFSNYGQYVDIYGESLIGTSGAAQTIAAEAAVSLEFDNNISVSDLRKDFEVNPKTFIQKSDIENADAVVYAAACNHTWEANWHVRKKATCTSGGVEFKSCTKYGCGAEKTRTTSALGHSYSWIRTTQPTCVNYGRDSYKCSRCGYVSNTRTVSKTGHNFESWRTTKKATCTATGKKERTCKTYGCHYTETQTISKAAHKYEWVKTKKPTCTEQGVNSYKCSVCGNVSKTEKIKKLGHSYGEWKTTKKATCKEKGTKVKTCKRSGCKNKVTSDIAKKDHKNSWVTIQATCTNDGKKQLKCSNCGMVSQTKTIPKLGHDYEGWRITKDSTCTATGIQARTCKRTGCHYQDTAIIEKKPHNNSWVITLQPTCTANGKKELKCSKCGTVSQAQIISPPGHDYEGWRITKDSTCTATGIQARTCKRTGCHYQDTAIIEKKPHTNKIIETKPTCTSFGKKETKCSVCGYVSKTETIDKLKHSYDNGIITKQPTCTETGTKVKTCKNYGCHDQITETISKKPHSYKYRPSTSNVGLDEEYCENCGFKSGKTKAHSGWLKNGNNLYYYDINGRKVSGSVNLIGSNYYYFDANGRLCTGWVTLQNGIGVGAKHYFNNSGSFNENGPIGSYGAMCIGFHKIGSATYYFDADGKMQTGKVKIGDNWYYFGNNGVMHTGWLELDGKCYYFNSDGIMLTGLQTIDIDKYYFDKNGVKQCNIDITINGSIYHFDDDGKWTNYSGSYIVMEDMMLPYKIISGGDTTLKNDQNVPTQISVEVNGTNVQNVIIPAGTVISLNQYGIVTSYTGNRIVVDGIDILANIDFHQVLSHTNKVVKQ